MRRRANCVLAAAECGVLLFFAQHSDASFVSTSCPINNKSDLHHGVSISTTDRATRPLLLQLYSTTSSSSRVSSIPAETEDKVSTITSTSATNCKSKSVWFPTRIQDTLDYNAIVQRLYVRHIVTETRAVAEAALQRALASDSSSSDPFGDAARSISTCTATRDQGGTIGWVEPQERAGSDASSVPPESIVTPAVIDALYALQPKAGDTHILWDESNDRWHVLQVSELWMNPNSYLGTAATTTSEANSLDNEQDRQQEPPLVGSFSGSNLVLPRRKPLKGQGILPQYPQQLQTYTIQTAGCQMNVADSERLEGILRNDLQLTVAESPSKADLVLFNTCSIRDKAERKLYDALGPYAAAKRQGQRDLVLVVTGCVAQQEGQALLRRVPEIDAVLGPQHVPHLRNILEQVAHGHQLVATAPALLQESNDGVEGEGDRGLSNQPIRGHAVRAWVNVIHGCNEHCTYCVVPATRGMEQSRTMEAILEECRALAAAGYREVTLLGQNIDAYGRDMQPRRTFAELLTFLNAHLPDKMRIRYVSCFCVLRRFKISFYGHFVVVLKSRISICTYVFLVASLLLSALIFCSQVTSHPRYFSDRVIDAVADLDKVCECFHMPFQAGDDAVLQRMRRGYTHASYMKIIDKIRSKAPDAAICADVIVGFPGETEGAFQKTLELMEEVKFDNVNSFAYSPRPNTEAALWGDQVDEDVKAERLQRVQQLAAKHGLKRSERYLGKTVEVLVEDANPRNPRQQVFGRTRQGRQVYFDGDLDELQGELVNVKITEARTWSLIGVLQRDDPLQDL